MLYTPLAESFIELIFDGASKENPRPVGYGGVLRDENGLFFYTFAGIHGQETNNAIEIWSLHQGLLLAHQLHYWKLVGEGDSLLVISNLKKLLNGINTFKLYPT
jgi:ribonuclease HI